MTNQPQQWTHPLMAGLPRLGQEIEALSHRMIDEKVAGLDIAPESLPVVRRMIHASADVDFGLTVRVHSDAITRGLDALQRKAPILCDVRMLQAGITRTDSEVLCVIREQAIADLARQHGTTRSAASMEFLAEKLDGAIVAIGNAPTALWKILELHETRGITPAVVVGLPVGFVGAAESQQALLESDLCYITNVGPRGGSPLAASAVNALAILAKQKGRNA